VTHSYIGRVPVATAGATVSPGQVVHTYTGRAPKLQARVQPGVAIHTYTARVPATSEGVVAVYGWGASSKLGTDRAPASNGDIGSDRAMASTGKLGRDKES
jgi:hypothetical protein